MRKESRILMAIAGLVLGALACQAVTGGGDSENVDPPIVSTIPVPPDEPTATISDSLSTGELIFKDDFSFSQWGTGTDSDSAVEYVDEALNFNVFTENYFVWSTPDDETYENIHLETTVINLDSDSTTAFGFICNKSAGNDFYYLAITPAGEYAIALASADARDVFLTNNDEWGDSDLIAVNASSYRLGADCGYGTLTLYVDGQQIASVDDSTYTGGRVAVMVWSGEETGVTTNVSFDDFLMTKLP